MPIHMPYASLQASEEEEFYKLRDHLCTILSYVHQIQTVYNVDQKPPDDPAERKGAHGVSSRCEKVGMLLPQRSYGSLKNHMLFITNS